MSAMKRLLNISALTSNVTLVPKCLYNLATICSGLEDSSLPIRLNINAPELLYVDLYT